MCIRDSMNRHLSMRSGNPVLSSKTFSTSYSGDQLMTMNGTINKTLISLMLLVGSGYYMFNQTNLGVLAFCGIAAFIVAIVTIFKKSWAPITVPLYAILEGSLLGGISFMYNSMYDGIVSQAIQLTVGILLALLFAYKSGYIKATENFKLGVFAATGGIAIIYLINFIMSFFGSGLPVMDINNSSMFSIGFSLVVVVIASLNLVLDFDFIEGTPPREVLSIENFAPVGGYSYQSLADDQNFQPITKLFNEDVKGVAVKSYVSGHGHEGPESCCEWVSKQHSLSINGDDIYQWDVWKDCGMIPIYPQGGTWPFDRAGWCPGTEVDLQVSELTEFIDFEAEVELDYSVQAYTDNGEQAGTFIVSNTLFTYGNLVEGSSAVMVNGQELEGAGLTSAAFAEYISFSGPFLAIAVVLFALSTMISWSYYGLQSWMYVFGKGKKSDLTYKLLFLVFIVIGAAGDMSSVWAFSDAMILALVFPNMIGLFILFPKVKEELAKYVEVINSKK